MQLDRTRIAIRARGTWDIQDLALRVMREYFRPLVLSVLVFAGPLMVFNDWMLAWIIADEYTLPTIARYLGNLGCLIYVEAPIATLATTLYLGQSMFLQPVTVRSILDSLRHYGGRIFWVHLVRGTWIALAAIVWMEPSLDLNPGEVLLPAVVLYVLAMRITRPFVNEIILLERAPLRAKEAGGMTVRRRSRSLHYSSGSDPLVRWFAIAISAAVLSFSLILSSWFVIGVLTMRWAPGPVLVRIVVPAVLWLVVVFTTVVRFLSYIDLRIRREGWEVELKMRAAANEIRERAA